MFFNSIYNDYGLVIRIDNVSHVIDYSHDGISVSPVTHTYLALDRQFEYFLPKPYSNCDDLNKHRSQSSLYKLIAQSKYDYSQKFCLQQCLQELVYKECNCMDSRFALLRNVSVCSKAIELECDFYKVDQSLT